MNYDIYPVKNTIDDFLNSKIKYNSESATRNNVNNSTVDSRRAQTKIKQRSMKYDIFNSKQRKNTRVNTTQNMFTSVNVYENNPLTPTEQSNRGFRFVFSPIDTKRAKDIMNMKISSFSKPQF